MKFLFSISLPLGMLLLWKCFLLLSYNNRILIRYNNKRHNDDIWSSYFTIDFCCSLAYYPATLSFSRFFVIYFASFIASWNNTTRTILPVTVCIVIQIRYSMRQARATIILFCKYSLSLLLSSLFDVCVCVYSEFIYKIISNCGNMCLHVYVSARKNTESRMISRMKRAPIPMVVLHWHNKMETIQLSGVKTFVLILNNSTLPLCETPTRLFIDTDLHTSWYVIML